MIAVDIPRRRVTFGGDMSTIEQYRALRYLWASNILLMRHSFPLFVVGGDPVGGTLYVHTYARQAYGWHVEGFANYIALKNNLITINIDRNAHL